MGFRGIFKKKSAYRRVAVIGLDGVPYSMIADLTGRGIMPATARLFDLGHACPMDSTLPPVSSVAWTSFMTGVNPAKHGIFGFMDRRRESQGIYFPNANQIQSPALWDILTGAGKTTVAVNIPQTYPAREINGVMISGFVAIDLEKAVYPHRLVSALRKMDYRIDVDYQNADQRKEEFFRDLFYTLKKRREVLLYLLDKIPWHLFIGVFTGTDRLQHYFWDDYANPESPWHGAVLDYYRALDAVIGEMAEKLGIDTAVLMLSDHGFAHLEKEVFPNAWLKQGGYLHTTVEPARTFEDIDMDATRAFVLDPGRLYVNLKGSTPRGIVSPGREYDELISTLCRELPGLRDPETGGAVIARVFKKQELYAGPLLDKAPDLVLLGSPGYDMKGAISKAELLGKGKFSGMHTHDDAFFFMLDISSLKGKPHIQDLAPTILGLLNVSAPAGMDGKALV